MAKPIFKTHASTFFRSPPPPPQKKKNKVTIMDILSRIEGQSADSALQCTCGHDDEDENPSLETKNHKTLVMVSTESFFSPSAPPPPPHPHPPLVSLSLSLSLSLFLEQTAVHITIFTSTKQKHRHSRLRSTTNDFCPAGYKSPALTEL